MSLQSFFDRIAALKWAADADWDWGLRGEILMARVAMITESIPEPGNSKRRGRPAPVLILDERQWNRVAWNVAFYGSHIVWRRSVETSTRHRCLELLARLVIKAGFATPTKSDGVNMFWDVVIGPAQFSRVGTAAEIAFWRQEERQLSALIFDLLEHQLRIPNKQLQLSALHGFNHLCDPRTPALVSKFSDSLFDDEVREFAKGAATFSHV